MYGCVHACMCKCMWKPEINIDVFLVHAQHVSRDRVSPLQSFYCCDETLWSKQLGEEMVYFSLHFQVSTHHRGKSAQELTGI